MDAKRLSFSSPQKEIPKKEGSEDESFHFDSDEDSKRLLAKVSQKRK